MDSRFERFEESCSYGLIEIIPFQVIQEILLDESCSYGFEKFNLDIGCKPRDFVLKDSKNLVPRDLVNSAPRNS